MFLNLLSAILQPAVEAQPANDWPGSTSRPWPLSSPTPMIASITFPFNLFTARDILSTVIRLFWQLYPLVRLAIYWAAVRNRIQYGVPQYATAFKRSRKIVWVLPTHIVVGITQLVLSELRRTGLLDARVAGADLAMAVVWGYTGLRLVKPLRRGHPPSTRAGYQFVALIRPFLEYMAWRDGDNEAYKLSIAFLDSFIWVRVLLKIFDDWKWFDRAWSYAVALPVSIAIGLPLSGFSGLVIPAGMGIGCVMIFNDIVSAIVRKRGYMAGSKEGGLQSIRSPVDIVLWGLLTLGFSSLGTLRATLHKAIPEFTDAVVDDYGYVPNKLAKGVAVQQRRKY